MTGKIAFNCIAFFTLVSVVNAQNPVASFNLPVNDETKLITYDKVVEVAETKKVDLFERAVNWINSYYKNPTDVVREKNPDAGKIVCKARFKISNEPDKTGFATDAGVVQYSLTLLFKDDKYKYGVSQINWKQLSYYPVERWMDASSPSYNKSYNWYLKQVDEQLKNILADLEKNMAVKKKEKKEDW